MNKQPVWQDYRVEHREPMKEYSGSARPPSLKSLQDQAILHRICAEVLSSSPNHRLLLVPKRATKRGPTGTHREEVLEILDGALCIVEPPRDVHTELSYEVPIKK